MRHSAILFAAAAFAGVAFCSLPARAESVTVLVDGSPLAFPNQPPVDRDRRVYVPMRAIFERLGATVVYSDGTIDATRGNRTISLQLGSPTAQIDGQPVALDAPPFELDETTLVPLRFVSQALGADISWSTSTLTAYITTRGMGNYPTMQGPPQPQQPIADASPQGPLPPYHPGTSIQRPGPAWADAGHPLLHRPFPWGSISQQYPLINASFRRPLRPDTVQVFLDGRRVTAIAKITAMGFEFTPAFRLHAGTHGVRVTGTTQDGASISDGWNFTVTP